VLQLEKVECEENAQVNDEVTRVRDNFDIIRPLFYQTRPLGPVKVKDVKVGTAVRYRPTQIRRVKIAGTKTCKNSIINGIVMHGDHYASPGYVSLQPPGISTFIDGDGSYGFGGLPAGTYTLEAVHEHDPQTTARGTATATLATGCEDFAVVNITVT